MADRNEFAPPITAEGVENEVISMAYHLAKEKIRNGTASSQLIVHFLKLGSARERLERDVLEEKKKYMAAKTDAIEAAKHSEELYAEAIAAMRRYSGQLDEVDND